MAASLLTAAGGALDAWVYLDHGHVFANAQTGNIVLFSIHLAEGQVGAAARHLPSMAAFVIGLILSRLFGAWLKHARTNSRSLRLMVECVVLVMLALVVKRLSDEAVTACVGFIAAVQITSLSHFGSTSFNTGMTTGNLRGAVSHFNAALLDPSSKQERARAVALCCLCAAFLLGAILGGFCALRWGDRTLFCIVGLVAVSVVVSWRTPDPAPKLAE